MTERLDSELLEMRYQAFDRIEANAADYSQEARATAVFVQESLFVHGLVNRLYSKDLLARDKLATSDPEYIFLLPDEYEDLRYRAALNGAGLNTTAEADVPIALEQQLYSNLENYSPDVNYGDDIFPRIYRILRPELERVLRHDYRIAAEDSVRGDLAKLCRGTDSADSDNEL